MSTTSDNARQRLVEALRRTTEGDAEGLRDVYALTSAKLFGICLRISQDRSAAEDILQDVYVRVWNRAASFDPARASPITWLSTIARNMAIDWLRARGARPAPAPMEAAVTVADEGTPADLELIAAEDRAKVHFCLDQLEAKQKQAIRSAFFDGLSYSELAARIGAPLGTVKSWIHRGMAKLRECIGDG